MVKFTIDASHLKSMLDVMNMFSSDAVLHMYEDRAEIAELSIDRTCMVYAKIDISVFKSFVFETEEIISFNMKKWNVIIKTLKGDVEIETIGNLVHVRCGKSKYTVTQIYFNGVAPKMPHPPYLLCFSVSMPDFKRAVDVCSDFAEIIHLKTDEDSFTIYANENENSSNIVFSADELKEIEPCMTFAHSALMHKNLSNFFKYVKSDTINISLGDTVPMNYRFVMMDGMLVGDFMVAPITGDV